MEKGENHRLSKCDVAASKVTIMSSYQTDNRKKTGLEYERSVFEAMFKSQPDVLKKAKFFPVRFKCPSTGKNKTEMRTRVYDQVAGTVAFEELEGSSVRVDNTVDNGEVNLMENQQERVMEDTSNLMFEQIRRAQGLTVNDVQPAVPAQASPPNRRGDAAAEKRKKEEESSDDDEDLIKPNGESSDVVETGNSEEKEVEERQGS